MFHGMNGHGWGMGWGWGWIITLIVLAVIIFLVVRFAYQNKQSGRSENKTPYDILKERYARGEIDKKEFDERKKDL